MHTNGWVIATDTRRVLIELDRDLAFDAGQYMAWQLPAARADGKDGVTRTYSMDLAAGDTVQLAGPYGRFTVRMGRREPAVLIAGGTGLAPIAAMIKRVLLDGANEHGDGPSHLSLYAGARTRAALYDVELFTELAAAHPDRFTYRPCLSEEEVTDTLAEQGFAAGMVTDVLAADHVLDRAAVVGVGRP